VPVNDLIANMHSLLRHTIGGEIAIETDLAADAGHGLCDSNQLENALLNLAINARDAMADGGTLTISTARVPLEAEPDHPDGDFVRISVSDTGEGMAEEVLARATEPFFSTKPTGKGTGLGLAQVYAIVQQSGGTMRIDSAPGRGTRVDLFIPAAEAPAEPTAAPGEALQARKPSVGAKILLVDDDEEVRAFLVDSLEAMGHEVCAAASGEEALEILVECAPDIALIDYAMPGMHGADVARAARDMLPHLPIVFVTGYAETEQLEAALGPRAPVLRKPFSVDDLCRAVEANLASRA
jgi:CheY-like chemotaxis protein